MDNSEDLPIWMELALLIGVSSFVYGFIFLPGKVAEWRGKAPDSSSIIDNAIGTVRPRLVILMIGILGLAFFGFVEILSLVVRNGTDNWFTHTVFSLFIAASIYLIILYFRSCVAFDENGASSITTTGYKGSVTWLELRKVGYSRIMERITFETRTGNKIRASANKSYFSGAQALAAMVLEKVNESAIDANTRDSLEAIAMGQNPVPHLRNRKKWWPIRLTGWLLNKLRKVVANRRRG